ncbi:hypothetical protein SAMD00019534_055430 [Acytostelium subglobosum LB1]|uniref:hypothetical protein n=1 Tax=Acytostelium subglobosum LB1 TaxID=1410327 RepID=UPI0006451A42|nr:hypothetical protein SAMD00019534_055430 [Acytostelium subglobosum LB1]GAM22368.1 hypothetical protein SAMD00019534_055430 [Acytostelium subglobosum LB1]|eukprot:XP_012754488.1 hypothetical protein SAMD00019534_055430 [Acytostelium subglobosum LB1]
MSTYDYVNNDLQHFAEEQLRSSYGEERKLTEWVDSRTLKSKRFKKRIIVVGSYRLLSLKKGKIGLSLNHTLHFYDISDLIVVEDTIEVRLRASAHNTKSAKEEHGILIRSSKDILQRILYHIREQNRIISYGLPSDHWSFRLSASQDYLLTLPDKEISIAEQFNEVYKGLCNYRNSPPSSEVCRLVERYVSDQVTDFDLTKCPGLEGRSDLSFNIEYVLETLKYNNYFTSVIVGGMSQKNILSAIGEVLHINRNIRKVSVSGVNEDQSLSLVGLGLLNNPTNTIQVLDFSNNSLSQSSIGQFFDGLESLRHTLQYLNLSNCGLNSRSIELLFTSLSKNVELSYNLEYLNLSGSKFEEIGSFQCGNWITKIKGSYQLKKLYLSACQLNFIQLGPQLRLLTELRTLDLSHNKMEKAEIEEVNQIFQTYTMLESIDLSGCGISNDHFLYLTSTLAKNPHIEDLTLNLSHNGLGKNVNFMVTAFEFVSVIKSLDITSNGIGMRGLTRLLEALRKNDSIEVLKLDNNFVGTSSEGTEFFTELMNFLQKKPSLKTLSLAGSSSCHIPGRLINNFLTQMVTNTTIEHLNISGHSAGDSAAPALGNLLENNITLKCLDIDRNHFTVNAFQAILLSLHDNRSLVHIPFPSSDFEKAIAMLSSSKKPTLFNTMHKIQMILEENGTWPTVNEHFYPTPISDPQPITHSSANNRYTTNIAPLQQQRSTMIINNSAASSAAAQERPISPVKQYESSPSVVEEEVYVQPQVQPQPMIPVPALPQQPPPRNSFKPLPQPGGGGGGSTINLSALKSRPVPQPGGGTLPASSSSGIVPRQTPLIPVLPPPQRFTKQQQQPTYEDDEYA